MWVSRFFSVSWNYSTMDDTLEQRPFIRVATVSPVTYFFSRKMCSQKKRAIFLLVFMLHKGSKLRNEIKIYKMEEWSNAKDSKKNKEIGLQMKSK